MRNVALDTILLCCLHTSAAQAIHGGQGITLPAPPATAANPVTDTYFGVKVDDNYRWLEDAKSTETRAFIDAQNAYTGRYLKQAQIHPQLLEDLDALEHTSHWSTPIERGENLFFLKRLAGEEQSSIYKRSGWTGKDERLIDPARLSRDADTSVLLLDVARDASLLAFALRTGGADEFSVQFLNLKTGRILEDTLPAARYSSVDLRPDTKAVYYTRHDRGGTLLFEHILGTRLSQDTLLFGREFHGEPLGSNDLFSAAISDDDRYLILQIDRGVPAHRVDIVFRDLKQPGSPFQILVWGLDARFSATWARNAWYVRTDYQAPNGRILVADPGILPDVWKTILPEAKEPIASFSIAGDRLFVQRLNDVRSRTHIYSLEGKPLGQLDYPSIGTVSPIDGRASGRFAFFSFESFIQPPTLYRYDTATGKREVFSQAKVPFDSTQFQLTQEFCTSKDGSRIPVFIAYRNNTARDGSARLLMTGYGGFKISETPTWNPALAWWLQQGGVVAMPNLRGGGEYGESWHQQGMFEKKQNVFDDWFAAAEFLIAHGYTSRQHFAIMGRSNGGLLMGASIAQRPDLFAAVLCGYPLLDMLRFQRFLVGSFWITEYGSSDNATLFPYLLRYSPYQNVKARADYPSVLFFTGDADTRVDPLHARKMTAMLQAASTSGRPILLHYSLTGGHSAGVSVEQHIQDDADQLAFLWTETGKR